MLCRTPGWVRGGPPQPPVIGGSQDFFLRTKSTDILHAKLLAVLNIFNLTDLCEHSTMVRETYFLNIMHRLCHSLHHKCSSSHPACITHDFLIFQTSATTQSMMLCWITIHPLPPALSCWMRISSESSTREGRTNQAVFLGETGCRWRNGFKNTWTPICLRLTANATRLCI